MSKHGLTGRPSNAAKPKSERAESRLNIRCKQDDHDRWREVAELKGMSKSEWIIKTLNHCSSEAYIRAEKISDEYVKTAWAD